MIIFKGEHYAYHPSVIMALRKVAVGGLHPSPGNAVGFVAGVWCELAGTAYLCMFLTSCDFCLCSAHHGELTQE